MLLEVQKLDTEMRQLAHRRATLPELAELNRLKVVESELADARIEAETAVSDLEAEQEQAESDLTPVRDRLARNQQRIAAGAITDPKALSAMVEEVAHLKQRISDLEDAELEVMEALEAATETFARRQQEAAELAVRVEQQAARRDEQFVDIDAAAASRKAARENLAAQLPGDLLALYTRLATGHAGVGAAELVQRRCTGCQLEVNAADLRAFAAAAADEVLRCEECGRILIRTEQSGL